MRFFCHVCHCSLCVIRNVKALIIKFFFNMRVFVMFRPLFGGGLSTNGKERKIVSNDNKGSRGSIL